MSGDGDAVPGPGLGSKPPLDEALQAAFAHGLPELFARTTLPDELAQGALMFVAQTRAQAAEQNGQAWLLYAPTGGGPGAVFRPCPSDHEARCQVVMAPDDYVALARKALNLEMAFMQGRLKVRGDMGCAMQLGALFG